MYIEHIAIWTLNLERLKTFYTQNFTCTSAAKYSNPQTGFESYFLVFNGGARLELMQAPDVASNSADKRWAGYAHIALSVGSKQEVDRLTANLAAGGCPVASPPRTTGDGYYESVILDPDGNRIEITV